MARALKVVDEHGVEAGGVIQRESGELQWQLYESFADACGFCESCRESGALDLDRYQSPDTLGPSYKLWRHATEWYARGEREVDLQAPSS